MLLYKQALGEGTAEIEIERSRFIAHVFPVETREEADEIIRRLRKEYRDATSILVRPFESGDIRHNGSGLVSLFRGKAAGI